METLLKIMNYPTFFFICSLFTKEKQKQTMRLSYKQIKTINHIMKDEQYQLKNTVITFLENFPHNLNGANSPLPVKINVYLNYDPCLKTCVIMITGYEKIDSSMQKRIMLFIQTQTKNKYKIEFSFCEELCKLYINFACN